MWSPGQVVIRREVLGLDPAPLPPRSNRPAWLGRSWLDVPVYVVEDSPEHLVTYLAPGAPFRFPNGVWPSAGERHPWSGRTGWEGHGCLMVQRPGEHHAVWHFWQGGDRAFDFWYVNVQTAFRRTEHGYDTQDLELDVVVRPDGSWALKDYEALDDRVAEGRFTPELADWVRGLAPGFAEVLDRGERWWDESWSRWEPPTGWVRPSFPAGA